MLTRLGKKIDENPPKRQAKERGDGDDHLDGVKREADQWLRLRGRWRESRDMDEMSGGKLCEISQW